MYKTKNKPAHYLNKTLASLVMLGVGLAGGYQVHDHINPQPAVQIERGNTQVRFSPKGGCTTLLTQAMLKAKSSLEIAIFDLTSSEIADALIALHKKGICVRILTDRRRSKAPHSKLPLLHQEGIPIRIAKCSGLMHHKFTIIDSGVAGMLTGSFNYTTGAENVNLENLLFIKSKELAKLYQNEWQNLWSKARLYSS